MTLAIDREVAQAEMARRLFPYYCEFVHRVKLPRHATHYWVPPLTTDNPDEKACAIAAPPEFWKSRTLRMFMEWSIGKWPERARLLVMNAAEQAKKQVMSVSDTIEHNPRYHMVFPHVVPDREGHQWNQSTLFIKRDNSARPDASLFGTGVMGPIQGGHYEEIYLDDLTDPEDVNSQTKMTAQRDWVKGLLKDRLITDEFERPIGLFFAILTRWGEGDLWDTFVLPPDPDTDEGGLGMTPIMLPAERHDEPYPWGPLLWPEEFSLEKLRAKRGDKGVSFYTMTYLCDPQATGGVVFHRDQWNRYNLVAPPKFRRRIHTWDTAGGKSDRAAYSVMQEWSEGPGGWYLTFAWRARIRYLLLLKKVWELFNWRQPSVVLIENQYTGNSLIQDIRAESRNMPQLRSIDPEGDKYVRAESASVQLDRGLCWVPVSGSDAAWLEPFLTELTSFPKGRYSDHVDAFSQVMTWISRSGQMGSDVPAGGWMFGSGRPPVDVPIPAGIGVD